MLEIKNLRSGYGRIEVLHGINITVSECQIVGVIGRNGAGKSTLLNTISGLVRMFDGEITLNNEKIPTKPHKVVRAGIVQVPEGRRIFPSLTVNENLLMGGFLATQSEFEQRREEIYELFPILKERTKQQAGTLSGGEQQMLAMGRGLMSHPKMLLLDEPSLGLAPILFRQVFDMILRCNEEKRMTIILVEQNARAALKMAHYAYVLEDGEIVIEGTGKELLNNPRVQSAYLGASVVG
jgi:branched-chain amino acid transport system ATP-binding protein